MEIIPGILSFRAGHRILFPVSQHPFRPLVEQGDGSVLTGLDDGDHARGAENVLERVPYLAELSRPGKEANDDERLDRAEEQGAEQDSGHHGLSIGYWPGLSMFCSSYIRSTFFFQIASK